MIFCHVLLPISSSCSSVDRTSPPRDHIFLCPPCPISAEHQFSNNACKLDRLLQDKQVCKHVICIRCQNATFGFPLWKKIGFSLGVDFFWVCVHLCDETIKKECMSSSCLFSWRYLFEASFVSSSLEDLYSPICFLAGWVEGELYLFVFSCLCNRLNTNWVKRYGCMWVSSFLHLSYVWVGTWMPVPIRTAMPTQALLNWLSFAVIRGAHLCPVPLVILCD